jgi:hypothetical protein
VTVASSAGIDDQGGGCLADCGKSPVSCPGPERKPRKPLTRPDGRNPDAFYRQVAEAYRDVVQDTSQVAKVLAKEADVPVGTVYRWILEARRRGFLPSARQGRAG